MASVSGKPNGNCQLAIGQALNASKSYITLRPDRPHGDKEGGGGGGYDVGKSKMWPKWPKKNKKQRQIVSEFFRKKFITLNDGDGDDDGDDIIIIIGMAAVAVDACNILWQSQRPFRKTRRANETLAMQMSCGNL